MRTEDEALKKLCPMAMGSRETDGNLCQGSRCMAWRWDGRENPDGEKTGYCGLAGDPS
jgi:hypothetical protein